MIRGLYAICDNTHNPNLSHAALARALLQGGAPILQLRIKQGSRRERHRAAAQIMDLKRDFSFQFIINDDPYLARDLGADGVHVGADDLDIASCRRLLGPSRLLGYSSHSLEEAQAAAAQGADYVAFGAIFPSPSKGPGHPVQGLTRLREVVEALDRSVVAIGGINQQTAPQVLATGASAIAVISALTQAPQISLATNLLRQTIERGLWQTSSPLRDPTPAAKRAFKPT